MTTRLPYPLCNINPATEKPYRTHKWVVSPGTDYVVKKSPTGPITYYRIRCSRCGVNDPNPPLH